MAGQIPQRFIDDLLGRVDVVEVVGERVQLKKLAGITRVFVLFIRRKRRLSP